VKELAKFDLMLERSQSSSGGHAVQGRGQSFGDINISFATVMSKVVLDEKPVYGK
jgi:hypothetical protein